MLCYYVSAAGARDTCSNATPVLSHNNRKACCILFMSVQRFNYKKDNLSVYESYGFHMKNGINHIDTKRLIKLGLKQEFPKELFSSPRNKHYFIPDKKNIMDYAVNNLIRTLNILQTDWNTEYKEAIGRIKTPEQVGEKARLDYLSGTCSKDDNENAEIQVTISQIKRIPKYSQVIRSIHLQYLQKVFIEYSRVLLSVISERGYDKDFFDNKCFRKYVGDHAIRQNDTKPLLRLAHYKHYDLLRCMDNFLKHNSAEAYKNIAESGDDYLDKEHKDFLASYVETKRYKYKSGMYAGDWLKIDETFVNETINNLREFSKELCNLLYEEDADEASWNSDEYLKLCLKKVLNKGL